MKTYYKVYSVGNNAQPSYIQDDDGSVFIIRKQKPIGQFDSPMHYHLDKYHGIQRSKQDYSIDSINEINSHEITILRNVFHDKSKNFTPFTTDAIKFCIAQYIEFNKQQIDIKRNTYGLIGLGPQLYSGINKPFNIFLKAKSCNVINIDDNILLKQYALLYKAWHNIQDYSTPLRYNYVRTRVIYPAKPLTHIFKEYSCNVYTPITYWKNLSSKQSAKFKYKKTAESPRQRAFKVNSVLVDNLDSDKKLNGASTTVIQKTNVVIDSSVGNFSLMVQKMEFFELKLEKVVNVTNLPEGVEYKNDSIKGSIANSGEYFINVKYNNDATQVINIIVPFYRRLL